MYEFTVDDKVFPCKFGMGFLREINKSVTTNVEGMDGIKANVGLRYTVMQLFDGDTEALVKVIDLANKGQKPRATMGEIEKFIESEDTDIDAVFEDIMGFLKTANATKKATIATLDYIGKSLKNE